MRKNEDNEDKRGKLRKMRTMRKQKNEVSTPRKLSFAIFRFSGAIFYPQKSKEALEIL
jgi:hypothetical protein